MLEKIKKVTEEQTQRMIFYGLAVLIFALPVPQIFMPELENAIGIQATVLTIALFYFGVIFLTECVNGRISYRMCGLAVKCVFGLMLVGVVSLLISENKEISLYGTELRWEGLFSLLSYYFVFLSAAFLKKKEYRKKLLYMFVLLGCIVTVIGVIQYTGIYVFGGKFPGMAYVPMRNHNFYGAFAVLFTGVGIGGFFNYKKDSNMTRPFSWWTRRIWYVIVVVGYTACICASSALVYAGLVMMLLMYLFLVLVSKQKDWFAFLALVAGLLGVIFLFNLQKNGAVTAEITKIGYEIKSEGTVFGNSVGSGRMSIWKQTVSLLPKYGLFGCGIDQLGNHCYEGALGADALNFDKAHNEYLNLWITEGFFAVVIYLVFLFALFIPGLKRFFRKSEEAEKKESEDVLSKIAFFAFFGYIAQAFFNISVVQVAPYFWLICGLLYNRKRRLHEETVDC